MGLHFPTLQGMKHIAHQGRPPPTLPAAARVPLVSIGAPRADSMSARATLKSLQMPDVRLQVIYPGK